MRLRAVILLMAGCLAACDPADDVRFAQGADGPAAVEVDLPEVVSFHEHVLPVMSEYCFDCHGADRATRKPKKNPLRLDRAEDAYAGRKGGRATIVPGRPLDSPVLARMMSRDPGKVMPPPKSGLVMTPGEIALIARWIEQGAKYDAAEDAGPSGS